MNFCLVYKSPESFRKSQVSIWVGKTEAARDHYLKHLADQGITAHELSYDEVNGYMLSLGQLRDGVDLVGGELTHDLEECKRIKKDLLRADRIKKFEELDIESMKAAQGRKSSKTQAEIQEIAKKLEDFPVHQRWDQISDIEELKSLTLDNLLA